MMGYVVQRSPIEKCDALPHPIARLLACDAVLWLLSAGRADAGARACYLAVP
jgi:hypothetical protein